MRYDFEWNIRKAKSNFSKHKISFERGATIFQDPNLISIPDDKRRGLTERQENFYHNLLQLHWLLNFSKELPLYFTDDEGNNWHLDRGCVKMAVNHGFLDELQDDVAGHSTKITLRWVKD